VFQGAHTRWNIQNCYLDFYILPNEYPYPRSKAGNTFCHCFCHIAFYSGDYNNAFAWQYGKSPKTDGIHNLKRNHFAIQPASKLLQTAKAKNHSQTRTRKEAKRPTRNPSRTQRRPKKEREVVGEGSTWRLQRRIKESWRKLR